MAGPTRSLPIRAPLIITLRAGRLTPAARLQVAISTRKDPWSYAWAISSRSSVVIPASIHLVRNCRITMEGVERKCRTGTDAR